jgi:Icc-related predicted phosphoesterase
MSVLIVADLHLDHWRGVGASPLQDLTASFWANVDALIVAGDLSNKPKVRWPIFLKEIGNLISLDRVYLIPGNHDFYQHNLDDEERLEAICIEAGAHFSQKKEVVIGNDRFLCCTLWTDFNIHNNVDAAAWSASRHLNDYRATRLQHDSYRRITPYDIIVVHANHRAWLDAMLAKSFSGRTFVVTHHAPLPGLVDPRYITLEPAYASDLTDMIMKFQPDVWIYGHTHIRKSVMCGSTLVKNVSIDYPFEHRQKNMGDVFLDFLF